MKSPFDVSGKKALWVHISLNGSMKTTQGAKSDVIVTFLSCIVNVYMRDLALRTHTHTCSGMWLNKFACVWIRLHAVCFDSGSPQCLGSPVPLISHYHPSLTPLTFLLSSSRFFSLCCAHGSYINVGGTRCNISTSGVRCHRNVYNVPLEFEMFYLAKIWIKSDDGYKSSCSSFLVCSRLLRKHGSACFITAGEEGIKTAICLLSKSFTTRYCRLFAIENTIMGSTCFQMSALCRENNRKMVLSGGEQVQTASRLLLAEECNRNMTQGANAHVCTLPL